MNKKKDDRDITNKILIWPLWGMVFAIAGMFTKWVGAYIVGIAFSAWLVIRTNMRKKAGTFDGSLLQVK